MAKAVLAALRDSGFSTGTLIARNRETGEQLGSRYGYGWRAEPQEIQAKLLINATPISMAGGPAAAGLPTTGGTSA